MKTLTNSLQFNLTAWLKNAMLAMVSVSLVMSFNVLSAPESTVPPLQVKLALAEPVWTLAINNKALSQLEVELQPHEFAFARQVQPLMQANNYQGVAELFKQRDLATDSTALQLLRGQVLLVLKDFKNAELALQASLATMPDLTKAHQGLSLLYMQQQQYNKALPHLIRSVELGRADAQVYAQLAYIHVQNDQPWSAIAAYRQALMLQPRQVEYQQGLLFALIAAGDVTQAQILLKELLNKNPNNADLWLQRAQLFLKQGNQPLALNNIEIALKLNPNDHSNQLLAAQLHLSQGSSERAVDLILASLQQLPKENEQTAAQVSLQTLNWLIVQQQWSLAGKLISQSKILAATFNAQQKTQFSVYSAQLAIEEGELNSALASLNKAININPNLGDALLSLASLYQQKNQLTQAKLMYVRAQALPEYKVSAWLGLAQLEIDGQHYKAALTYLKKAYKAQPQRHDLMTNIRALEKLVRREG